jgi:hypothetical protein
MVRAEKWSMKKLVELKPWLGVEIEHLITAKAQVFSQAKASAV